MGFATRRHHPGNDALRSETRTPLLHPGRQTHRNSQLSDRPREGSASTNPASEVPTPTEIGSRRRPSSGGPVPRLVLDWPLAQERGPNSALPNVKVCHNLNPGKRGASGNDNLQNNAAMVFPLVRTTFQTWKRNRPVILHGKRSTQTLSHGVRAKRHRIVLPPATNSRTPTASTAH